MKSRLTHGQTVGFLFACGIGMTGWTLHSAVNDGIVRVPTREACVTGLYEETKVLPYATESDLKGTLRVLDAHPGTVEIADRLCIVVAGVLDEQSARAPRTAFDSAKTAHDKILLGFDQSTADPGKVETLQQAAQNLDAARIKAERRLPDVKLAIFFDDIRAPFIAHARATPEPQPLLLELPAVPDAEAIGAKFWRELLRGTAVADDTSGTAHVRLGIARDEENPATPDAEMAEPLRLQVFSQGTFAKGVAALAAYIASFAVFAASTTLLRDNSLLKRDLAGRAATLLSVVADPSASDEAKEAARKDLTAITAAQARYATSGDDWPVGSWSLGRTQMAVWFVLVLAAYVFVAASLGQYLSLISPGVLVLLGISGATGLLSVAIPNEKTPWQTSKGPMRDLLYDSAGPQLQRIQALAWTLVLAATFVYVALKDFRLEEFDTNLLLLMGISSSLYLGFKTQET